MRTLAVIGLGNIAKRHRNNLKSLFPKSKLIAMSASGREPEEQINDCDMFVSSVEELVLANAELVIVASPAPFHAQHTLPLIRAGIPTLIEKPLSVTSSDALLLCEAAQRYSTPVAVGYCLRYLPSAKSVKKALCEEVVGKLYNAHIEIGQYLPDWRPNSDYRESVSAKENLGGGALLELSHELDYVQWLLGPLSIEHAVLRCSDELGLEVEDCVDLVLRNDEGVVINVHMDMLQQKAHRKCRFVGSDGALEWDLINNSVILIKKDAMTILYSEVDWDKNQMYLNMINDFINCIEGKAHSCIELSEAHRTVELIQNIKLLHTKSRELY